MTGVSEGDSPLSWSSKAFVPSASGLGSQLLGEVVCEHVGCFRGKNGDGLLFIVKWARQETLKNVFTLIGVYVCPALYIPGAQLYLF